MKLKNIRIIYLLLLGAALCAFTACASNAPSSKGEQGGPSLPSASSPSQSTPLTAEFGKASSVVPESAIDSATNEVSLLIGQDFYAVPWLQAATEDIWYAQLPGVVFGNITFRYNDGMHITCWEDGTIQSIDYSTNSSKNWHWPLFGAITKDVTEEQILEIAKTVGLGEPAPYTTQGDQRVYEFPVRVESADGEILVTCACYFQNGKITNVYFNMEYE